jgi:predicted small integral membrane protein
MTIRYSKILLLAAIALFASLVAFGNMTDYGSNFAFVRHVLLMDTVFPDTTIRYRAIESTALHHAAYITIIALETATAVLCWAGAWRLWRVAGATGTEFNRAKNLGVAGLTLGFLTWQTGFMTIGGEWFGMWMSRQWNGVTSAYQFFSTIGLVLIYLVQRDADLEAGPHSR